MLNKFIGIGRLTKDPELRYTNSGKPVCNFTLAVEDGYGDNRSTQFIDCVAWSKTGENIAKYTAKGRLVYIEGVLKIRRNKEGDRVYVNPEITVRRIQFLGGKKADKTTDEVRKEAKKDLDKRRGKTTDEDVDDSFDKEEYEGDFDEEDFDVPF